MIAVVTPATNRVAAGETWHFSVCRHFGHPNSVVFSSVVFAVVFAVRVFLFNPSHCLQTV